MAFVKLDTGILRSTLWMDRVCREVFITSLLMAEPRDLPQMEQYHVRDFGKTGWCVPTGWYGFVDAAGVGICRIAMVEQEEGMAALERLGSPEADSRTPEFEGRRLVRVNGGYVVLNYMKYRDYDHGAAERMRLLRARRKSESATAVLRTSEPLHRTVTYADADADADKNQDSDTTAAARPTRKAVSRETSLDGDFWLDVKLRAPQRSGSQPMNRARKAASARHAEGHTKAEMLEGLERYARFIEATGKESTEFVMQLATFFGPDKPFLLSWAAPAKPENATARILRKLDDKGGRVIDG